MPEKTADYTIISKPDYIKLKCPHCHNAIETPCEKINFYSSSWSDGGEITCPDCHQTIILGDYEYE